jgi:large subunit ribosomal protein L5
VLRLLDQPTTFRTIPKLEKIVVHAMASGASDDSAYLHAAGMAIQAITGVRVTSFKSKKSVVQWNLRKGKYISVKAEMKGEDMYHFLEKCIDAVMPRIKDWKGVRGSSGDSSGNLSFGLSPEDVALFPEVEVNYDM